MCCYCSSKQRVDGGEPQFWKCTLVVLMYQTLKCNDGAWVCTLCGQMCEGKNVIHFGLTHFQYNDSWLIMVSAFICTQHRDRSWRQWFCPHLSVSTWVYGHSDNMTVQIQSAGLTTQSSALIKGAFALQVVCITVLCYLFRAHSHLQQCCAMSPLWRVFVEIHMSPCWHTVCTRV